LHARINARNALRPVHRLLNDRKLIYVPDILIWILQIFRRNSLRFLRCALQFPISLVRTITQTGEYSGLVPLQKRGSEIRVAALKGRRE
jgi:hypothetical protein